VQGLCLLNPWVRSEASLARTHVKHYYAQRLREPAFWKKLFSGQVAGRALRELGSNLRAARRAVPVDAESKPGYQARMAAALAHFDGATLLVLSGNDYTAREFDEYVSRSTDWQGLLGMPRVSRQDMPGADHTFSTAEHRETINATTLRWLRPLA
jgi:hypothetical protein